MGGEKGLENKNAFTSERDVMHRIPNQETPSLSPCVMVSKKTGGRGVLEKESSAYWGKGPAENSSQQQEVGNLGGGERSCREENRT